MAGHLNSKIFSLFLFTLFLMLQGIALAEFYEYVDEHGVKTFTDDHSRIPQKKAGSAKTHKERYDHLEKEQREAVLQKEQSEIDRMNREVERELELRKVQEAARDARQKALARQKKLETLKTKVVIENNQILVPVELSYAGKRVTATLLLDTGASITVISQAVAHTLGIQGGQLAEAVVAGGGIIRTRLVDLQTIRVGPKSLGPHQIMVMAEKGPEKKHQGLLGQDFLQAFNYTIDYDRKVIRWSE